MANVQTISFNKTGADADLQAQQAALQRQQMIADMLRKQSAEPMEQQVVSGRVVPISGFQAIAKVLQGGLGAYAQKKGDEQQAQIGETKAKRSADALRALFSPTGTAAPAEAQLSSTPQASMPGQQIADQAPAAMSPEQQRAMAAYQIDPELGRSLMTNMFNQTNEQKNNAAEGVDPRLAGALRVAKMRKDGVLELQPGTTSIDLATGTERFAPRFGEGMRPTANGGAEAVPGYGDAAAGIAGKTAEVQAAAQAGYQLQEIIGPDGVPRLVTKQQAAQLAGGAPGAMPPGQPMQQGQVPPPGQQGMPPAGPPNAGFPPGAQVPPRTPGPTRLDILLQEQQKMAADPRTDPRDMAAIQREIAGAGGGQQAPALAMPGIPMQTEAQREEQVGAVKVKNAVDEAMAKQLPQERKDRQIAIAKGESAIALIDKALKHPGLPTATGLSGTIDPRNYVPGTDAKDFQVVMDQLGGQTFLQAYESLKGGGGITEIEGKKATDAIARLNRSQSTEEFKTALNDFKDVVKIGISRARSSQDNIDVARDKLEGKAPPNIDDLLKKYGGK